MATEPLVAGGGGEAIATLLVLEGLSEDVCSVSARVLSFIARGVLTLLHWSDFGPG